MKTFTCNMCGEIHKECKCYPTQKSYSSKSNHSESLCCHWRDSLGGRCRQEHRIALPIPGMKPSQSPSKDPGSWRLLCEEHYEYDRPTSSTDILQENKKNELEQKYGTFESHKGKDMIYHCLQIIYEMEGKSTKVAEIMKRAAEYSINHVK